MAIRVRRIALTTIIRTLILGSGLSIRNTTRTEIRNRVLCGPRPRETHRSPVKTCGRFAIRKSIAPPRKRGEESRKLSRRYRTRWSTGSLRDSGIAKADYVPHLSFSRLYHVYLAKTPVGRRSSRTRIGHADRLSADDENDENPAVVGANYRTTGRQKAAGLVKRPCRGCVAIRGGTDVE